MATICVPIAVWFMPRPAAIAAVGVAAAAALVIEWARTRFRWARYHFLSRTRPLLRPHERRNFAGATYMVIGYLLALLFFPHPIAVVAMFYGALGDATAALIGKRWGRHRTRWGKSWEGAAAGMTTNFIVGLLVPGIGAPAALVGALVAAAIEFLPIPLDDNIRVTLGGGLGLWIAVAIMASM